MIKALTTLLLVGFAVAGGAAFTRAAAQEIIFGERSASEADEGDVRPVPIAQEQVPAVLVTVPAVTIYPNQVITDAMLTERDFAAERIAPPKTYLDRAALVGKVAKQTLLPKSAIAPGAVREPFAVKQGQPAAVIFQSGGLTIAGSAVPLEAGSIGDVISLRNVDSGTTIRGVVMADGTVRVGGP